MIGMNIRIISHPEGFRKMCRDHFFFLYGFIVMTGTEDVVTT